MNKITDCAQFLQGPLYSKIPTSESVLSFDYQIKRHDPVPVPVQAHDVTLSCVWILSEYYTRVLTSEYYYPGPHLVTPGHYTLQSALCCQLLIFTLSTLKIPGDQTWGCEPIFCLIISFIHMIKRNPHLIMSVLSAITSSFGYLMGVMKTNLVFF